MRIIIYSHDAFGLGNIRRMLAISQHLQETITSSSILILSGSPAIHSFRIPDGIDYIKLPCISRDSQGSLNPSYLETDLNQLVQLRADLIKTTVMSFQPDLLIVDKKPYGLLDELQPTLDYIKSQRLHTKLILLLRDILDHPKATIKEWKKHDYYQAIDSYYDRILIVGTPDIFDAVREYKFPLALVKKTKYCGYIRKEMPTVGPQEIRQKIGIGDQEKLIVVTPGGGEDGYPLIDNYLDCLEVLSYSVKSIIILGREMPRKSKEALITKIAKIKNIVYLDFSLYLVNYLSAADLIVSMAGYNTITEILSLQKKVIAIPRCYPSLEQSIRVAQLEKLGLLSGIKFSELTPERLAQKIKINLTNTTPSNYQVDFSGLDKIRQEILELFLTKVAVDI
ncbi:glycosyltransferase family protein [Gloeocapsa sp. PCC 73106]|uniref:glycosyltransferase family protein n=1 Tax=Gloeocapsa sp. PCC 73106 TaxID=102232 RepID=UPI0002ACDFAC|nr:glycosyltransferase [Gloeocapsa sp. PCC 73106]ELR99077.1 putative glycosyl transferase [Gloeocapsa sp. PCC 73106]